MKRKIFSSGFVIFCGLLLLGVPNPLPGRIGAGDFTGYWSASYLLAHGMNFAEPGRLLQVERNLTGWPETWPIVTWNPPWLLVLLIPYTLVSFARAAWWWVLTSIVLTFTSAAALWQLSAMTPVTRRLAPFASLIAFGFAPTLAALVEGQVSPILLAALAGFLYFESRRGDLMAGASLALTTVKPHLVYITVPVLLLDCAMRRRWRTLAGFILLLTGLSAIAFFLRPTLVSEYGLTMSGGSLLAWENPTLGGVLDAALQWQWSKGMGAVVLPLMILIWWHYRSHWDVRTLFDLTLLVSVITAPFGWSYDFVVLLVPLTSVIVWIVENRLSRPNAVLLILVLIGMNAAMFYERLYLCNEVYFFWVPLVIAGVYIYGARGTAPRQTIRVQAGSAAAPLELK
jgi:hypothetical protein